VPEGQRVNSVVEVIGRLLKHIFGVRSQFRAEDSLFLLHNSASTHSALVVKIFLSRNDVLDVIYPPYSPDLASMDFLLFPMVKTAQKRERFQNVEDIMKNVTAELNAVPLEAFADCFKKLFKRCNKCIQVSENYFE
jgi:hypothetical protein